MFLFSPCNPYRLLISLSLTCANPNPCWRVHEGRNAAYRDTEIYTHDFLISLYIFYMPLYKLFSTARSYSLGLVIFLHNRIFLLLQIHTYFSIFMFHKSITYTYIS